MGERVLRTGQTGDRLVSVMLVIVIAAAIGLIGTDVTEEIDSSISVTAGSNFDDAANNISSGYASAMGLTDIVFIVLMFSVILGALLAFRARS